MAATSLPPGFRFHPTDVELVKYYLKRKVLGKKLASDVIAEVDIYKNEPWDLRDKSYLKGGDLKWYFFCPRERKYANGGRLNRATECGYWKTTGKDRAVLHNSKTVGMIKTLVFHKGRAPKGDRTDWVMHEYRLDDKGLADGVVQDAFVLCIVFQKDGPGPRNGAQYGAPFKEDDWTDDEEVSCVGHALSAAAQPVPAPSLYSNENSSKGSEILCTSYDESLSWSDLVWKDLESTEDSLSLEDLGIHALSAPQPVPAPFLHINENSSKGSEMLCTSYDEGLSLSDLVSKDLEPAQDGLSLSDLVWDDQVQGDDDLLSMMDSFWEDSPGVYLFHPEE